MRFSTATRVAAVAGATTLVAALAVTAPAFASGPNHGRIWESGIGGINVNAEIYVQPSYSDGGKHAAGGRVHLWRSAGPAVNVYGYTPTATSRYDTRILHVKKTVRDSLLPGSKYVTRGTYATTWFGPNSGGCVVTDEWAPAYESTADESNLSGASGLAAVDTSSPDDTAAVDSASDAPQLWVPC